MTIISDPIFYLVAIPAILMFGMSKGGFGGGISSLSIPLMAFVIDPITAAAIMLPTLLAMDAVAVWKFRHSWEKHHLIIMLPAATLGILIAALLMGMLSTAALKAIIGVVAVLFCLQKWCFGALVRWLRPDYQKQKPGKLAGYIWGLLAGFTSTQIHAGAIPASIYLLPQNMDKMRLMGTTSIFFAVVNLIKLLPYILLGQFDKTNLATSLLLMPLAPIGVLMGYHLLKVVKEKLIYQILYVFLFVAGTKLVFDALLTQSN